MKESVRLCVQMGVIVMVGIPIVAYLWETLNQLLSLHVQPTRLWISLPLLVVLWVWLRWLSRRAQDGMKTSP